MNRQFFLPQPALANFVRYFIGYQMHCPTKMLTTMPANPFSGLVFSFKVPMLGSFSYSHNPQATVGHMEQCDLIGQSNAFAISEVEGDVNVVVAALTGTGLEHLLGESVGNATNQAFKFGEVSNYFEAVQEKLWRVDQIPDAVALIEQALLTFFYRKKSLSTFNPNDVSVITRYIEKNYGLLPIKAVAEKFRITPRWLEKLFHQQVGLSPKAYSRVIRFNGTLQYLLHSSDPSWLDAVEQFGYTDQSHFIKDFQALLGTSPTQFFQNDLSFNKASQNAV